MKLALLFLAPSVSLLVSSLVQAQVIEDGTLSTEVSTDNNSDFTVNAGEQKGNNLFHSFAEFSIPNNGSVVFNNGLSIQNIITRVTGSSISNINGLIQSSGTANLFLINPNGIIFGENASLNIGGSFVGTTAESLVFEDDTEFSTNLNSSEPLLTVSVPLGLQFGSNPGEVINQANFSIPNPADSTGQGQIKLGLTTAPEKTLALLGGDITFDGGAVTAAGGNVELGSVGENSFVSLESTTQGWKANYDNVGQFKNIQLDNLASVDASGEGGGDINIWGKNIQLFNGSAITSNTLGDLDGGTIQIQASNLVEVNGSDRTGTKVDLLLAGIEIFLPFATQISSYTLSTGKAGNIEIITNDLQVTNGGSIELLTFPGSTGLGGDLFISTTGNISLTGTRPLIAVGENAEETIQAENPSLSIDESIDFNQASGITNSSVSNANGGNITIESKNIRLEDGTGIGASPFRNGDAGDINLTALESIEIVGTSPRTNSAGSAITTNTFAQGNAGNINLDTSRLSILDGGLIVSSTSSVNGGNAGNIAINSRTVEINGVSPHSQNPSLLSSETNNESTGGNIAIDTDDLVISDRGILNIRGTKSGSPGNLQVNANSVRLSNNAQITAENAAAVDGGNIALDIEDSLTLEDNSLISAQAFGDANGGNLDIEVGFLIARSNENNDILATAIQGDGGNITIRGDGIFGIQQGSSKPPNSSNDIDASSEFGLDGTVSFNFPEIKESNFGRKKSRNIIADVNNLLGNDFCKINLASEYYFVGKGGMAISPDRDLLIEDGWSDFRFFDEEAKAEKIDEVEIPPEKKRIEPIQGWFKDSQGRLVLTAKPLVVTLNSPASPHPDCNTKTNSQQF